MRKGWLVMLLVAVGLGGAACSRDIGDECDYDRECPLGAYCDLTMPGGMCTDTPCRKGECPGDSVCIEFANGATFCMATCEGNGDCRDGYECIDDEGPWPFCSVRE